MDSGDPAAWGLPLGPDVVPAWAAAAITLGTMVAAGLAVQVSAMWAARRIDAGRLRSVRRHDRVVMAMRLACVLAHAVGVLVLGWLDAVRRVTGDIVLVDEAITVLPLLLSFVASWWSSYPLERRLREAVLIRELDEGKPVHPIPSRWSQIVLNIRHQMLLGLLPMLAVTAWTEVLEALHARARAAMETGIAEGGVGGVVGRLLTHPAYGSWVLLGMHLLGVLVIVVTLPLILRWAWDTAVLESGPLLDRLISVARASNVRVTSVLVWRTRGTLVNGAVLGVTPPWRYVLLSDALLENLSEAEVEAVMAHELGHIRRGHIPWLLVSVLALSGGLGLVGEGVMAIVGGWVPQGGREAVQIALGVVGLVLAIVGLGFVSRRFEWQADAFAAQRLSRREGSAVVTPGGAGALQSALRQVADLNSIPVDRFGFRHGSIADRVRRLGACVGGSVDDLPIDRTARRIKWSMALLMAAVVCAGLLGL